MLNKCVTCWDESKSYLHSWSQAEMLALWRADSLRVGWLQLMLGSPCRGIFRVWCHYVTVVSGGLWTAALIYDPNCLLAETNDIKSCVTSLFLTGGLWRVIAAHQLWTLYIHSTLYTCTSICKVDNSYLSISVKWWVVFKWQFISQQWSLSYAGLFQTKYVNCLGSYNTTVGLSLFDPTTFPSIVYHWTQQAAL